MNARCCICHKTLEQAGVLHRINAKGVSAVWACPDHISQTDGRVDPEVQEITDIITGSTEPMMINLRGTSGAGKSTVFTTFMKMVNACGCEVTPVFREGRRQPWFYSARSPRPWRLLGHYETACGGCDTIKTVDEVYDLVRAGLAGGEVALFEGIMVQDDVKRAVAFNQEFGDMHVIALTTPIEECLSAIRDRRKARGDDRPLNEKNTRGRAASLERTVLRLEAGGVPVERLDRNAALTRVCRLVGLD